MIRRIPLAQFAGPLLDKMYKGWILNAKEYHLRFIVTLFGKIRK